ncbi:hypothetical protein Btru_021331 [Bulinus truncatus]|nr:hypothetical protein Btru_021331 [Bulinus truncatus]
MGNGSSFEQVKTIYLDINGKEEKIIISRHSSPLEVQELIAQAAGVNNPTDTRQHHSPTDTCQHHSPTDTCQHRSPTDTCQHHSPTDTCQHHSPSDTVNTTVQLTVSSRHLFIFVDLSIHRQSIISLRDRGGAHVGVSPTMPANSAQNDGLPVDGQINKNKQMSRTDRKLDCGVDSVRWTVVLTGVSWTVVLTRCQLDCGVDRCQLDCGVDRCQLDCSVDGWDIKNDIGGTSIVHIVMTLAYPDKADGQNSSNMISFFTVGLDRSCTFRMKPEILSIMMLGHFDTTGHNNDER